MTQAFSLAILVLAWFFQFTTQSCTVIFLDHNALPCPKLYSVLVLSIGPNSSQPGPSFTSLDLTGSSLPHLKPFLSPLALYLLAVSSARVPTSSIMVPVPLVL